MSSVVTALKLSRKVNQPVVNQQGENQNVRDWMDLIDQLYKLIELHSLEQLLASTLACWQPLINNLTQFLHLTSLDATLEIETSDRKTNQQELSFHIHFRLMSNCETNERQTSHLLQFERLTTQAIHNQIRQTKLEQDVINIQKALIFQLSSPHLTIPLAKKRERALTFLAPEFTPQEFDSINSLQSNFSLIDSCPNTQTLSPRGNRIHHISTSHLIKNGTFNKIANELKQTHQLTLKEITLSLLLAQGTSLKKISQLLARSENTLRSQLKSIYKKVGKNSQSELSQIITLTIRKQRLSTIAHYYQTIVLPLQKNDCSY